MLTKKQNIFILFINKNYFNLIFFYKLNFEFKKNQQAFIELLTQTLKINLIFKNKLPLHFNIINCIIILNYLIKNKIKFFKRHNIITTFKKKTYFYKYFDLNKKINSNVLMINWNHYILYLVLVKRFKFKKFLIKKNQLTKKSTSLNLNSIKYTLKKKKPLGQKKIKFKTFKNIIKKHKILNLKPIKFKIVKIKLFKRLYNKLILKYYIFINKKNNKLKFFLKRKHEYNISSKEDQMLPKQPFKFYFFKKSKYLYNYQLVLNQLYFKDIIYQTQNNLNKVLNVSIKLNNIFWLNKFKFYFILLFKKNNKKIIKYKNYQNVHWILSTKKQVKNKSKINIFKKNQFKSKIFKETKFFLKKFLLHKFKKYDPCTDQHLFNLKVVSFINDNLLHILYKLNIFIKQKKSKINFWKTLFINFVKTNIFIYNEYKFSKLQLKKIKKKRYNIINSMQANFNKLYFLIKPTDFILNKSVSLIPINTYKNIFFKIKSSFLKKKTPIFKKFFFKKKNFLVILNKKQIKLFKNKYLNFFKNTTFINNKKTNNLFFKSSNYLNKLNEVSIKYSKLQTIQNKTVFFFKPPHTIINLFFINKDYFLNYFIKADYFNKINRINILNIYYLLIKKSNINNMENNFDVKTNLLNYKVKIKYYNTSLYSIFNSLKFTKNLIYYLKKLLKKKKQIKRKYQNSLIKNKLLLFNNNKQQVKKMSIKVINNNYLLKIWDIHLKNLKLNSNVLKTQYVPLTLKKPYKNVFLQKITNEFFWINRYLTNNLTKQKIILSWIMFIVTKDSRFIIKIIFNLLVKTTIKKHKYILIKLKRLLIFFSKFLKTQFLVNGIRFEIKGKIGVKGNAKKKKLTYRGGGGIPNSFKWLKLTRSSFLIYTDTGVLGCLLKLAYF